METRIIVADDARARIFASDKRITSLEEQSDLVHSEAHLANRDLVSDSPGKSRGPQGALDARMTAREQETIRWAKTLSKHLKKMHNEQRYEQLILVAPPGFLGALRKELPKPLDSLVVYSIDKDLTRSSVDEILQHVRG